MNTPTRGRGAQSNPDGRFSKLRYEADGDALDAAIAEADGELPGPLTQFLPDATQPILAHNDSPDIGFDTSLNPYRGCEHSRPNANSSSPAAAWRCSRSSATRSW